MPAYTRLLRPAIEDLSFRMAGRSDIDALWPVVLDGQIRSLPLEESVIKNFMCGPKDGPTDLQRSILEEKVGEHEFEIACVGKKTVAAVCVAREGGVERLTHLSVDRQLEGQGLGSYMLKKALRKTPNEVLTSVATANQRAVGVLRFAGFETVSEEIRMTLGGVEVEFIEMRRPA